MSLVALIMNVLLGGLLIAALGLGWRLERRLKALRDSQQSFAQAIADLDRAAERAEQGLADLRAATDEASEALAGRIDRAQQLSARLDSAMSRAPRESVARESAPREPSPREFTQRDAATRAEQLAARLELGLPREAPARADTPRDIRTDLILEDAPARRPFTPRASPLARAPHFAPPAQAHRSRARVDDDLFADSQPPRPGLGARR